MSCRSFDTGFLPPNKESHHSSSGLAVVPSMAASLLDLQKGNLSLNILFFSANLKISFIWKQKNNNVFFHFRLHPPVNAPPANAKPRDEAKAAACMAALPLKRTRGKL